MDEKQLARELAEVLARYAKHDEYRDVDASLHVSLSTKDLSSLVSSESEADIGVFLSKKLLPDEKGTSVKLSVRVGDHEVIRSSEMS